MSPDPKVSCPHTVLVVAYIHAKACRALNMVDILTIIISNILSIFKGMWQVFIIPVGVTAWAVYRDIMLKRNKSINPKHSSKQKDDFEHDERIAELSTRHQDYMSRIESDFQELLRQFNETEAEITILRREKWQTDLQVRAWRHACRDAQQIVWALQRQGCAAGSELTRFKQIEQIGSNSVPLN